MMFIRILLTLYTVTFLLLIYMTASFWVPINVLHYSYGIFLLISIPYFATLLVDLFKSKRQIKEKILLAFVLLIFLPYHIYYIWFEYGVQVRLD